MLPVTPDPWTQLQRFTPARIALGRAGASQPTAALLSFSLAHAKARDAVHEPLQVAEMAAQLDSAGMVAIMVHSRAADRETYLRRPDLGRRLNDESRSRLLSIAAGRLPIHEHGDEHRHNNHNANHNQNSGDGIHHATVDLAWVIADGLSAKAAMRHAVPLIEATMPMLASLTVAPVIIVEQGRVALGDEIGELLNARLIAVLIGERPGLSSPDSLGVYLTWQPRVGCTDAQRNCLSNIRPEGLAYPAAAFKLSYLIKGANRLGLTGVALKDESEATYLPVR